MSTPVSASELAGGLTDLERASAVWMERGDSRPLARWLARSLDAEGVPRRLSVPDWGRSLARLAEAQRRRSGGWPDAFATPIEGMLRAVLRFSRPDGVPVFDCEPGARDAGSVLRHWAGRVSDPGLKTVVNWWFSAQGRRNAHAPPPLPAWSDRAQPLAVLRADWASDGDFVALDHRARSASCAFELFGHGRTWLGPEWASGESHAAASSSRMRCWVTNSSADLAEWAFKVGDARVVRTAVLLRGRQIALLADQVEGPAPLAQMCIGLANGVRVEPAGETRGLTLVGPGGKGRARLFPIALPARPEDPGHGRFAAETSTVALVQPRVAKRTWLPVVASWAPERNRLVAHWRTLTVSEKSKPCAPGTAFAARLSWGREETLVVYRSLGRPALRAFLGHQTRARFLIAMFTKEGKVEPLIRVDE